MLLTLLLAAGSVPANALAVSASGGFAFASRETSEGSYLEGAVVGAARLQYDRKPWNDYAGYFGGVLGYEHIAPYSTSGPERAANVGLIGPTFGARWGDKVRGSLRLAGGFAFAEGALYREGSASFGWFFDFEGEVSTRTAESMNVEVFLALPIVTLRSLRVVGSNDGSGWAYFVPIIPMVPSIGVRRLF